MNKWKVIALIVGLFVTAAGLLAGFQVWFLSNGEQLPPRVLVSFSLLVMAGLCTGVLFTINEACSRVSSRLARYREQLDKMDKALKAAQAEFNETVERRTFEISVINASLNREIAERIQAEYESKRLQRQMELILQSAGEGIFGLDLEGNVTFVNKAATVMLGWSSEELVGQSHHSLVHHAHGDGTPYPADECPINLTCHDGQVHFSSDDVFWCRDGTSFSVEYVSTPIVEEQTLTGAVVVFRDMNTFT
jgi:PAS domain S-box-containing protein